MRSYISAYINSLTKGQQVLATDFIWADRRYLTPEIKSLMADPPAWSPNRLPKANPMTVVHRSTYANMFAQANENYKAVFAQANKSAGIREVLDTESTNKLDRIEAALQSLESEVEAWETYLCSTPDACHTILRDFGALGLRPVWEQEGTLQLLSTIVETNVPHTVAGDLVKAESMSQITQHLFSDEIGFQVRLIYNFVPGKCDSIRLEPLTGIGELTLVEMRVYGAQGSLIATPVANDILNRTLEYSIERCIVSRIEFDLLDRTYNLDERARTETWTETEVTTVTGVKRTVIPGKTTTTKVSETQTTKTPKQTYVPNLVQFMPSDAYYISTYGGDASNPDCIEAMRVANDYNTNVATPALNAGGSGGSWVNSGYSYSTTSSSHNVKTTTPDQILLEPYEYQVVTTVVKSKQIKDIWYLYEIGLKNLVCKNSFYTESLRFCETIKFEGGLPSVITLTTDEYIPAGSYINFFLIGLNREVVPLIPKNREWNTEVLHFNQYGQANLLFSPEGEIYYYKNEGETTITFPTNGRAVLGPSNNMGELNTLGGSVYWTRYQPDQDKSNFLPYVSRLSAYVSPSGDLGEVFSRIPANSQITLHDTPHVDPARLTDITYSPVAITIEGYKTTDLTNWSKYEEDEFPVESQYQENERVIHYKVRGNTVFFEESVDRPVRIFYESLGQYANVCIEMGVIHRLAAAPVLYSYTLSYI